MKSIPVTVDILVHGRLHTAVEGTLIASKAILKTFVVLDAGAQNAHGLAQLSRYCCGGVLISRDRCDEDSFLERKQSSTAFAH
jgi:hypothetical protein